MDVGIVLRFVDDVTDLLERPYSGVGGIPKMMQSMRDFVIGRGLIVKMGPYSDSEVTE